MSSPSFTEPVNLLSFDGGGVRGISSLLIIHEIMRGIQERFQYSEIPKPCDYFDIIGGTSTGGLIAIMLGRLRMSTEEAIEKYDEFAKKIFCKENKTATKIQGRFGENALKDVIDQIVRAKGVGDTMRDPNGYPKGKAFVCAMPAKEQGEPKRVCSYQSGTPEAGWDKHIKIWEAARATTAASSYFTSMKLTNAITGKSEDYIDAAISCNNPTAVLLKEAELTLGTGCQVGCIISIGTGTRHVGLNCDPEAKKLGSTRLAFGAELIQLLKNTSTTGRTVHEQLHERFKQFEDAYVRFDVPQGGEVGLADWEKMEDLKAMTRDYLRLGDVAAQITKMTEILETRNATHGLSTGFINTIDPSQTISAGTRARQKGHVSRYFTGRVEVLERLDKFFAERPDGSRQRREFVLHGMGGVGKTQIALKAAEKMEDRFPYTFYLDGTDETTIKLSWESIVKQIYPREQIAHAKEAIEDWMKFTPHDWLLIFDNCTKTSKATMRDPRDHLPRNAKGNIIYTTRQRDVLEDLPEWCVYTVSEMDEPEAITMFFTSAGSRCNPKFEDHQKHAKEIVQAIGCLPLAVAHAAAYIKMGQCSLAKYLEKFTEKRTDMLRNANSIRLSSETQNQAVYATFEMSYRAIVDIKRRDGTKSRRGRAALNGLRALSMLCFCHNERFMFETLSRAAHWRAGSRYVKSWYNHDAISIDREMDLGTLLLVRNGWAQLGSFLRGVQLLEDFSLVRIGGDNEWISMHVLVHSWARDRMDESPKLKARQALETEAILLESVRDDSTAYADLWHLRDALPHIRACRSNTQKALEPAIVKEDIRLQYFHEVKWHYLTSFIFILVNFGEFREAESLALEVLSLTKRHISAHGEVAIICLRALCTIYNQQELPEFALPVLLEIKERVNLSLLLDEEDRLWEVTRLEVIERREQKRAQSALKTQNKAAVVTKGAVAEAAAEEAHQPSNEDGSGIPLDIKWMWGAEFRQPRADLEKRADGVLIWVEHMTGCALQQLGDDEQAAVFYQGIIDKYHDNPLHHVKVEKVKLLLAKIEAKGSQAQSNREFWDVRIQKIIELHGLGSDQLLSELHRMADSLHMGEDYAFAKDTLLGNIEEYEKRYGPRHHKIAANLVTLGMVCNDNEDYYEGEKYYRKALANMGRSPHCPAQYRFASLLGLAMSLRGQERREEACQVLEEYIPEAEVYYGRNSGEVQDARDALERFRPPSVDDEPDSSALVADEGISMSFAQESVCGQSDER